MEIKKYDTLPDKVREILKTSEQSIEIGGIYIDGRGETLIRIDKIIYHKKNQYREEYVEVHYEHSTDWENTEWSSYGSDELDKFNQRYTKLNKSIQEHQQEALDLIAGKLKPEDYSDSATDDITNNQQGLISKNSKQTLILLQKDLEDKRTRAELLAKFVNLEMEKRKSELNKMKEAMYGVVAEFQKKIKKIMRVITTIELYLGIDEEIFQIQDGQRAPADTPINFRQAVLYMDEEIGHWEDGGLDYTNIGWFDEWLYKDSNYKKLLPEEKGVVVFRPRRFDKDYGNDDFYGNAQKNKNNENMTYLLIRNGECLYRIYTEKIVILPRLFPQRKELEALLKQFEVEEWESEKERKKEHLEDIAYQYRKRAVLLQGLIDRSEVFTPMSQQLSIFDMDKTPGMVNFIYDDELTLPSGRLPFHDWWKELDKGIKVGSRILITGHYNSSRGYSSRSDFNDRFYNKASEYNTPELPKQGVYEVEEFKSTSIVKTRKKFYDDLVKKYPNFEIINEKDDWQYKGKNQNFRLLKIKKDYYKYGEINGEVDTSFENYRKGDRDCYFVLFQKEEPHLTIKYQPGGDARKGWNDWGERKNKVRFRIYPEDGFLMNYDQLDLKDVEFYINSRVDRPNYLNMMPLLLKIREERIKEFAQEKEFIKFIVSRNVGKIEGLEENDIRKRVIVSLVWFKYKNKYKRPITKDDTLALRMIEKRIASKNWDKLKKLES